MIRTITATARRPAGGALLVAAWMLLAGCATDGPARREVPRACVTELPGLAPYTGEQCRRCENVHVAAPGEARRCGLSGRRPGGERDSDADGVIDRRDACPDTRGGADVLASGCERVALDGVNFALDSARLRPGARSALERQVDVLRRSRDLRVEIAGHTDARGASGYNRELSLRRARAVRDYFVANGIDRERLVVEGYGESDPVVSDDTAAGRERNRRVELRVLDR